MKLAPGRPRGPSAARASLVGATRIALLAALAAAGACSKSGAAPPQFERPPAPVRVAVATVRDVPVYLDEIGRAVAKETVWIRAEVAGRVAEARVEDGAETAKGDLLFTIDRRPFEAALAAAEAELARARANLVRARTATARPKATLERARAARDLAASEFARAQSLIASKAVSQADFDARRIDLEMRDAEVRQAQADVAQSEPEAAVAEAEVRRAEADAARARLDLEYCEIRSPIDGRAGHRLVDAGNLVTAMGDPLVMVERLDPVYVEFTVPENRLAAVRRHASEGALRVEVRLPDDAGEPRAGELTFVDNAVQSSSGTVKLRATVPNADHRFWPGAFVRVRLVLTTLKDAVLVPLAAPQTGAAGPYVFVVKDDGTADLRQVVVGQTHGADVVLASGVNAGERVVVAGQLALMPGGKVRIEETPLPEAPK